MDNIKNYNPAEAETLDSREVAEMVEKQHRHLSGTSMGISKKWKNRRAQFWAFVKTPKNQPVRFLYPEHLHQ